LFTHSKQLCYAPSVRLYNGVRMLDAPSPTNIRRLDHGCLPMIHQMHQNGIRVDIPYLQSLQRDFTERQSSIEWDLMESIGHGYQDWNGKSYRPFSIGSPDQVARLLFKELKVQGKDRVPMTNSEKRETTSDDVLEKYRGRHPAVGHILDWRELEKLCGTYVLPLQERADEGGRVHTSFSTTTAATGRLSSKEPNLQNIPTRSRLGRLIRMAFTCNPGNVLVSCDLSQIEMRWAAHLSQDDTMMGVFLRDEDIHDRTACEIFGRDLDEITALKKRILSSQKSENRSTKGEGEANLPCKKTESRENRATETDIAIYKYFVQFERLPSKTLGFGILYGQTARGLLESILTSIDPEWSAEERAKFEAKWTLEECDRLITRWYTVYHRIRDWMDLQFSRACRRGQVWCPFGRVRLVPEVYSAIKRIKAEGLRKAGNHPIQAGAQGTIKLAMAELTPLSQFFASCGICWPLLQIHDELIFEVDKSQAKDWSDVAREVMEHATPLSIPVKSSSDIAERWGDLK
jgi:DNA polymerase I